MYIATTPTFVFTVGIDTSNISELLLTFQQNRKNILTLTEDDVTMTGNRIEVTLTQAQTKLFAVGKAFAQIRVKLNDDTVEASNPMQFAVDVTFNTEAM